MLNLKIPSIEYFDEETSEFIVTKDTVLHLEHSLVSISKWESRWKKPFLSSDKKTREEQIDYVKCMTITQNVDPFVYLGIPEKEINIINEYVNDAMTATTFNDKMDKSPSSKKLIITSELIYYWMIALNIPFECQKWHINRLLTLIKVCNIKNDTSSNKKLSKSEILARNRRLNAERRQKYQTKG